MGCKTNNASCFTVSVRKILIPGRCWRQRRTLLPPAYSAHRSQRWPWDRSGRKRPQRPLRAALPSTAVSQHTHSHGHQTSPCHGRYKVQLWTNYTLVLNPHNKRGRACITFTDHDMESEPVQSDFPSQLLFITYQIWNVNTGLFVLHFAALHLSSF